MSLKNKFVLFNASKDIWLFAKVKTHVIDNANVPFSDSKDGNLSLILKVNKCGRSQEKYEHWGLLPYMKPSHYISPLILTIFIPHHLLFSESLPWEVHKYCIERRKQTLEWIEASLSLVGYLFSNIKWLDILDKNDNYSHVTTTNSKVRGI